MAVSEIVETKAMTPLSSCAVWLYDKQTVRRKYKIKLSKKSN